MPTNRTRRKKHKQDLIPIGILEKITKGYTYLHDEPHTKELQDFWSANRDFIMGLIGKNIKRQYPDYFFSSIAMPWGSRPWGWWQFEAPEPRRLLSGNPGFILKGEDYFFGLPRLYTSAADHTTLTFESQPEYLERLNLLLPGEKRKIKPNLIKV